MSNSSKEVANKWDDIKAKLMSDPEQLLYRSNLLGSDIRVTNYGGGNTSAKLEQVDPLTGQRVSVLWVKGSGGDIGSMGLDGFATLYMEKLSTLPGLYRGEKFEDEMVDYLPLCTFNLNTRAASIDTPLHAYLPYSHVDHLHPDAVIAIAASKDSHQLTNSIFEGEIGWLPWRRPGFHLGLELQRVAEETPHLSGVLLENHGLFTWADSAKECYLTSLRIINKAQSWLSQGMSTKVAFDGVKVNSENSEKRHTIAARLMPLIRGMTSQHQRQIGHFDDSDVVLEFVNSNAVRELASMGTSCPDHFLRTKIRPLVLDYQPESNNLDQVVASLSSKIDRYRDEYTVYYERCKHKDSPFMRDPNPVVYLIPGVGMLSFAKDKPTARIAGEFYVNAINVMRGAHAVSRYVSLSEQEAFDIEYWQLEEAKLQRMPKPREMAGKIALVTGGAGGIGLATASRLLSQGANVVLADIDKYSLLKATKELEKSYGKDTVKSICTDVTNESEVRAAVDFSAVSFGGLDIIISNAGIASSAPLEETSLDLWNHNISILSTGYFLVAREGFRLLMRQKMGGNMVFVASKNGLVASPNASAYCTAKASEIQLARCVALEGAEHGIRVNTVNPDAVLRGSKIWTGKWREERASAYKLSTEELEEHYRQRSMLKLNVTPEDIAKAIYFFASNNSEKSTGNILNVDAGNAIAFTR